VRISQKQIDSFCIALPKTGGGMRYFFVSKDTESQRPVSSKREMKKPIVRGDHKDRADKIPILIMFLQSFWQNNPLIAGAIVALSGWGIAIAKECDRPIHTLNLRTTNPGLFPENARKLQ